MTLEISNELGRMALAEKIVADIDAFCKEKYDDGFRSHLGASLIGHSCWRYLWFVFRWCHKEEFDGRMQRLFNRGHREEARWFEWLRATGWTVKDVQRVPLHYHAESNCYFFNEATEPGDPLISVILPEDETYERHVALALLDGVKPPQIRVTFAEGHGGGSLDAELEHPDFPGIVFLGECKTYGTKAYEKILPMQYGTVNLTKPQHWSQMCIYGFKRQLRYAVYMPINKNDDDIKALQVLELDWRLGEELCRKGEEIIVSQQPPPRLSDNPAWQECKWCAMWGICHNGERVEKNCRSCQHAQPARGGEWYCNKHANNIPKDFIPKGCDDHMPLVGPQ